MSIEFYHRMNMNLPKNKQKVRAATPEAENYP